MNASMPVYPFVAIDVPESLADAAACQLFELGALGIERRDSVTCSRGTQSQNTSPIPVADIWSSNVEWNTSSPESNEEEWITLVASFSSHDEAYRVIEAFDAEFRPRLEEVVGDHWKDAWKEHFKPFRLSPHIVVTPPWCHPEATLVEEIPNTKVLVLEPGRAFGTGLHESTALIAQALECYVGHLSNKPVLDVGCGSGILALTSLLLGASSVMAVDIDPDAVRITLENAERANCTSQLTAACASLEDLSGQWPVVLANIQAEVLIPHAQKVMRLVRSQGLLILSGLLNTQRTQILEAYASMHYKKCFELGEWIALVFEKPNEA